MEKDFWNTDFCCLIHSIKKNFNGRQRKTILKHHVNKKQKNSIFVHLINEE